MEDERWRCTMIDGKNSWVIDRERPIEVVPDELIKEAALKADRAFVTIGRVFGEGKDRDLYYSYMLQEREHELLRRTAEAFHARGKKVTVILNVGGVVELESWQGLADAILLCWQPGEEGGHTVASVLSGEVNPSGRLPMTISKRYEDEPSAPNFPRVFEDKPFNYSYYRRLEGNKKDYTVKDIDYTDYDEDIYVGYRYFCTKAPKAVAYPFGFGLSYTTFRWSDLQVTTQHSDADGRSDVGQDSRDAASVRTDGSHGNGKDSSGATLALTNRSSAAVRTDTQNYYVSIKVTNTGNKAGKDVVELYITAPGKTIDKPTRELKAFAKTPLLAPGQSCTLHMTVPAENLASWDEKAGGWTIEQGRYRFIAARSAADKGLTKTIRIRP